MIATLVFVDVIPEFADAFAEITAYNHENSRKEPGNVRFDVLHDNKDPNKFVLYEVYADTDAAVAHKETEHYKKWRETVAPMMASPRSSIPTTPYCFD
ncbi:MAG: antibiotic biosynthesis monooxygenase [Clostridia bacterium]|nr:antibiotic biosynthesis monooxygenase [Clostridia bacterium]